MATAPENQKSWQNKERAAMKKKITGGRLPRHIAVIMDGNGRWAKERSLTRIEGHKQGAKVLDDLMVTLLDLKIPYISLFAFSTDNWRRPKAEIMGLFQLLNLFIENNLQTMMDNGIRFIVSGNVARLPAKSRRMIKEGIEATQKNRRLHANFCLNYGARDEIFHAIQQLIETRIQKAGKPKTRNMDAIFKSLNRKPTAREFEKHLYTRDFPDVDLLIRTSGELRLSNFLLYQCAYAEFYFTSVYWPDFNEMEMYKSLLEYQERNRRYGGIDG